MASLLTFFGILTTLALADAESHFAGTPSTVNCSESGGSSCENGWSGRNCDIPICDPPCRGDQVCITQNNCGCLKSGTEGSTNCPYAKCTLPPQRDCYPGTCAENGVNCTCPTQYGFAGDNCLTITATPQIKRCTVELRDSSTSKNLVRQANCAASGYNNSVTWINTGSLGDIRAQWDAWYQNGPLLPGPLPYIIASPITIVVSKASVTITMPKTLQNMTKDCTIASGGNPQTAKECDETSNWPTIGFQPLQQNDYFSVTVSAQLGGQKQVNLVGTPVQQFIGTPITRTVTFKVDRLPPVHCLTNNPACACPYFAIYLDQDIRTNPTINPKFYNWTDDESGIARFEVMIYKMGAVNDQLQPIGDPLPGSIQDIYPNGQDYRFTMGQDSGTFSVVVTVYDQAGNTANARKLFIYMYNKDAQLFRTHRCYPVYLQEANESTNYTWLTNFDTSRDGSNIPLTVIWTNHFISSAQFNGDWALPATPWNSLGIEGIDDRYGNTYGRRSITAIGGLTNGIAFYDVAYFVDSSGGGRGLSPPSWVNLNSTIDSYKLPINQSLSDGNTIVVWVQAIDVAFGPVIEKLVIGVDRSSPEIQQQSFQLKTGQYKTNTSLIITVFDHESGIANLTYRIFASQLSIFWGVFHPPKRVLPSNRGKRDLITPCEANDTTCYCIPQGDCFNYILTIDIDNCVMDRQAGQYFTVEYTVFSLSGGRSITQILDLGILSASEIPCR